MTQNITYATAIDQAIEAVMHHCADDSTKNAVIKRLNALKNFELNMGVLSRAMCHIRADAIRARHVLIKDGNVTTEGVLKTINQIEKTADSLHNVGTFMISGIACDAAYLLRHGVDDRWPTGISEAEPHRLAIQKLKDALKMTVKPLSGYEDRTSIDLRIFSDKSLVFCSSSINKGTRDDGNV